MISEIISAIVFEGHTLMLKEIMSVAVFLGVIVAVYAVEGHLIIGVIKSKRKGQGIPKRFWSGRAVVIHLLAIVGVICLLYGHFIEPYWIEVKTVEVPTNKLHQTIMRIVQISDTHCTWKPGNEKKLVEIINRLKPDVIVFTGDSANNLKGLKRFKETMGKLEARLGKFAVRGNIDADFWPGVDIFGGTGFVELDGNSIEVKKDGEKIWITGVSCEKEGKAGDVLKKVPDDCFSVFLYYFPDLVEDLNGLNVDLYLAGHTHGGQIALPFYGAIITLSKFGKKYESG
ncbi:MAG: metallophosphoesterase [Sedimentisphaerales bacterium]|jgi:predicted MPP superfamily phosphohydrolase